MSKDYKINIAIEAQTKALEKVTESVSDIKTALGSLKKEATSSSDMLSGAYLNIGAQLSNLALKMPSAISKSIQAFGEEEMAIQKLSAAIRANGGRVSEVLPIMQQFASDMQKISGYGDEQILAMQGVATSMGVTSTQMESAMKSAIGLSAALGMDVATATKAASAAIQGKTELLTRYIPMLSECKTTEEKFAKVQELSRSGFEQAEAASESLIGKLKAAANAWGDLQEVVGDTFTPTVKAVAGLFQGFCEIMSENKTVTKLLTSTLAGLAVGFAFTKVGGLLNVAKMFAGIATATGTATGAMHGLNLAIKANPIGLITSLATGAILALSSLASACGELSEAEKLEEEAQEAVRITRGKATKDAKAATAILDEYAASVKRSGENANETEARIDELASEIEKLSERSKWSDSEQAEMAQKLVDKKKELAEVQKLYLERVNATANAEYQSASGRETTRRYLVEMQLNEARKVGIAHIIKFREAELEVVEEEQKSVEIQKKYYADHEYLVRSESDRLEIMAKAKEYAKMTLAEMYKEKKAAEEKGKVEQWLAAQIESSKTKQRALEIDILRARAAGDEVSAREKESKLRIAQLSDEIFEATKKEGMSRKELEQIQSDANKKAAERYNLEKSVTDEVERQNLAKDAQAKIEDILLTNKIEQLRAEGKLAAAKELENEREIKRTLAGLKGVSTADKKKLAQTMRQTNTFKDRQLSANAGSGVYDGSRSPSGGLSGSKTPAATVSAKNADLYKRWKAQGGAKSGASWIDFRDENGGYAGADTRAMPATAKSIQLRTQARGILSAAENKSAIMAGAATGNRHIPKVPASKAERADVSDPALGLALNNASGSNNKAVPEKTQKFRDEILKKIDELTSTLDSIKNTTDALATSN